MPKTLTATVERQRERSWAQLVCLLELTLYRDKFGSSPTSITVRLSDRARYIDGQEWVPLVRSWGEVGDLLGATDPGGTLGALDVELDNTLPVGGRPRFSDLVRLSGNEGPGTYDLCFAEVTLKFYFTGGVQADQLPLFRLLVEEAVQVTETSLTLRMSSVELGLEDVDRLYRVSTVDFPSAARSWVGKAVPLLAGKVKGSPLVPLIAGFADFLSSDMSSTQTTVPLSSLDILNALPSSGTVQVESERISYTGKNTGTLTLTGATRGASNTIAETHVKGVSVLQILTEYVLAIGENVGSHKHKAVNAVYWDSTKKVLTTDYTVELENTTLLAGHNFSVVKIPPPAINLIANTTTSLPIARTIDHNDPGSTADIFLDFPALPPGFTAQDTIYRITFTLECNPTPNGYQVDVIITGASDQRIVLVGTSCGSAQFEAGQPAVFIRSGYDSSIEIDFGGNVGGSGSSTFTVTAAQVEIRPPNGSAGRTGSGDTPISAVEALIGLVTADVEGLKDDGSGTISGTANLLLENPTDVTKLLLREAYGEKTASLYAASRWAATRASHAALGWTWAGRFAGLPFSQFRRLVGLQARAELYQEGGLWIWSYRDLPAVQSVISDALIPLEFGWTPRTDCVTRLALLFDRDEGSGQWRGAQGVESATYADRLGLRRGTDETRSARTLELPWVPTSAMASALGTYWLRQWERPLLTLRAVLPWEAIALEKTDALVVTTPLLGAFGGTAVAFGIRAKSYRLDAELGLLEITGVELVSDPITPAIPDAFGLVGDRASVAYWGM